MQRKLALWCLALTGILAAFTLGFYFGTERMQREQVVQISAQPIQQPAVEPEAETPADHPRINLNTATVEELQTLPGIGPVLAQRILDYRDAFGPFTVKEQLMDVEGIGPTRYERLQDFITIS